MPLNFTHNVIHKRRVFVFDPTWLDHGSGVLALCGLESVGVGVGDGPLASTECRFFDCGGTSDLSSTDSKATKWH